MLVGGCVPAQGISSGKTELTAEEKALRDSVVGEYEYECKEESFDTVLETMRVFTYKDVFLENGIREHYINGKKEEADFKWSIVDGKIHIHRINPDKSITAIAHIEDGKRRDN